MKIRRIAALFAAVVMLGSVLAGCEQLEPVDPLDQVYTVGSEEVTIRRLFEGSEEVLGNASYPHVTGSCHSDSPGGEKDDNDFAYERHYTDSDNYEDIITGNYENSSITSIIHANFGCNSSYEYSVGKRNGVDVEDFSEHKLNSDGFTLKQNMVDVDVRKVLFPDLSNVILQFSGQPDSEYYYVTLKGDLSYFNGSFGRGMRGSSDIYEVCYYFSADTHLLERVTVDGKKCEMKEYIKGKQTELIYRFRAELNVEEVSYE